MITKNQYSKYRQIPIEQLAADAVFEQAEAAKFQQKTGNRLVDMLHENVYFQTNKYLISREFQSVRVFGVCNRLSEPNGKWKNRIRPNKYGNSIKTPPTFQIAKAVFEKFQKQILPGLVANLIAGKNPLQLPQ